MIYVFIFVISLIFLKLSLSFKNNKLVSFLFLLLAFLIPSYFAAVRSPYLGVDYHVYVLPFFKKALISNNIIDYIGSIINCSDYLYLILTYISAKFFKDIFYLLFFINIIIMFPIYKALKLNSKNDNQVVFGMFLFFVFLYNASFNMVRQSISLAISFLAISYLDKKQIKAFFIISLIAFLFHWSAFILLIIYFIWKLTTNNSIESKKKFIIELLVILVAIVMIFALPSLLNIISSMGILSAKFIGYLDKYSLTTFSFSTADTLFFCGLYVVLMIYKNNFKEIDSNYNFYRYMLLLGIFILQFGGFIQFAYRLSYYFLYPIAFIQIPKLISISKSKHITLYDVMLISMFIFYWYFWVVIANYHGTMPYVMR